MVYMLYGEVSAWLKAMQNLLLHYSFIMLEVTALVWFIINL